MSMGFVSGPEADEFRRDIPTMLAKPPWNYNQSLIQGREVTYQHKNYNQSLI